MKASFRAKLFRLLLLFAVLPAVMITLVGYYLAVESPLEREAQTPADPAELSDYYHDRLNDQIKLAIEAQVSGSRREPLLLDFLLTIDSNGGQQIIGVPLPPDASALLREAAERRDEGMVQIGEGYCQYVKRQDRFGRVVIGGIRHDRAYGVMLESVRQERASRSSLRELRGSYVVFLGGLFLIVTISTIGAAYVLSRRVSRRMAEPLSALGEASTRIAEGDFSQQVSARAEGEIAALIVNFNRMASTLEGTTRLLAQTERVAAWRQVARRFAHELKNPLQPILVSLYRIEKQVRGTELWEAVREPLEATAEEVRHLTTLAERFSTLAKLPPPKMEVISLNAVATSVADLYRAKLAEWRFELNLPDELVHAAADEVYLREALHNLLQNAMDATPEGKSVALVLEARSGQAVMSVTDEGAGMDSHTLASARLPYFTTKQKGTGLGLAVVEKFVSEMGGQLTIASRPGVGTTVSIILKAETKA